MGTATDSEVKSMIDDGVKFDDIFEWYDYDTATDTACPEGMKGPYYTDQAGRHECLRLRSGMEKAAAYLETGRYAAYKGATYEWRKMEGMTYSYERN